MSAFGSGSSSHGCGLAQVKEELGLVSTGLLPPSYKELVSASIHLAPPRFHEGVSYCPPKKLLERTLADNIQVSHLYFSFVVCSSLFILFIYSLIFKSAHHTLASLQRLEDQQRELEAA